MALSVVFFTVFLAISFVVVFADLSLDVSDAVLFLAASLVGGLYVIRSPGR